MTKEMTVEACPVEYASIETMRHLYRREAACQIVRDSILRRGMADAYLLLVNGRPAGYGGVWNQHWPGRLMEFYVLPHIRQQDSRLQIELGRALIRASGATHIEAQTNIPGPLALVFDAAANRNDENSDGQTALLTVENLLFADNQTTVLPPPTLNSGEPCLFRALDESEARDVFTHHAEPVGAWCIEGNGGTGRRVLATGGFLTHYNPPYADVFMEVDASVRQQGLGAYLVQEIKRVCYEAGYCPAARCSPGNTASQRTLQRAGFRICGHIVSGAVRASQESS